MSDLNAAFFVGEILDSEGVVVARVTNVEFSDGRGWRTHTPSELLEELVEPFREPSPPKSGGAE